MSTSALATSTVEITGNLVPPPTNPVLNPLPVNTVVNIPVADFSGLVTNALAGTGEVQTVGLGAGLGLGVPGAVHVIHSDVTASIGPDGAIAFNLPLIPLEAALGGDHLADDGAGAAIDQGQLEAREDALPAHRGQAFSCG